MAAGKPTVVIAGGGYTGAAAAVDISRHAPMPLDIRLIEPRPEAGRGVAYSARHRDHRLNAPTGIHYVVPEEPDALDKWWHENVGLREDPEAKAFDGSLFIRRWDFGSYVNFEFERHQQDNPSTSALSHVRAAVTEIERSPDGYRVITDGGDAINAKAVIITTSNDKPSVPHPLAPELLTHPALLSDPWDVDAIQAIPDGAHVFIVGAGLTAADVIAALWRQGHKGEVTSVSRRGLRPTSRPKTHAGLPEPIWDRIYKTPSLFKARHGLIETAFGVLRAVRADVEAATAAGLPWQTAFDDLRDSAHEVWQDLPLSEQRRAIRHALAFYDIHRFRFPPQTEDQLAAAEAAGVLLRRRGSLMSAAGKDNGIEITWRDRDAGRDITQTYDHVVVCTGPETRPTRLTNPLFQSLLANGLARPSAIERGFDVDATSRALGQGGNPEPGLFFFGPLTFARFFYSLGVPFILPQIRNALPHLFEDLGL